MFHEVVLPGGSHAICMIQSIFPPLDLFYIGLLHNTSRRQVRISIVYTVINSTCLISSTNIYPCT